MLLVGWASEAARAIQLLLLVAQLVLLLPLALCRLLLLLLASQLCLETLLLLVLFLPLGLLLNLPLCCCEDRC